MLVREAVFSLDNNISGCLRFENTHMCHKTIAALPFRHLVAMNMRGCYAAAENYIVTLFYYLRNVLTQQFYILFKQ